MTSALVQICRDRRALRICAVYWAILFTPSWSFADEHNNSLLEYAVNIQMRTWTGSGIYLGRGIFITAAHVVGHSWLSLPSILINGRPYPTRIVKEGRFETTDLTLLSVEENLLPLRLTMRRNSLCKEPSWPGQQVVTVTPGAVVRSYVIAPQLLPIGARRFNTAIADVATTGNSGSGVFDVQKRCLLGIMSRKISQSRFRPETGKTETRDIAKYFVPASEIAAFLPEGLPL